MSKVTNVLAHLVVNALFGTLMVLGTGALFVATTGDLTWYEYGQIALVFVGLTAFLGIGWSLSVLVDRAAWYWGPFMVDQRLDASNEVMAMYMEAEQERRCEERTFGEGFRTWPVVWYGPLGWVRREIAVLNSKALWAAYKHHNHLVRVHTNR